MPAPKDPIKRAQWAANISAAKTGKKLSPEPIAKIAAAQKIAMNKSETLLKLSAANSGENHPFYGKHHTPEIIAILSNINSGENNPFYGKKHSVETIVKMKDSLNRLEVKAKMTHLGENHPMYGKHLSAETIAKLSVALSGENNPNYIDGSRCNGSSPNYNENFTKEFRRQIRERDNHICQLCNKIEEENGRKLTVHHIFYDEETNDCSNDRDFITLCISCHMKTNFNREYWTNYFLSQIS